MITNSAWETEKLGERIAERVKKGGVIALYGELGSGKTTFVKGLARGLGIKKRIISPTFIFIRRYEILQSKARAKETPRMVTRRGSSEVAVRRHRAPPERGFVTARRLCRRREELASPTLFYHIDLYRIRKFENAQGLGPEEILNDPQNIVVIEWAEKIKNILPKKRADIYFKYLGKNKREIIIKMLK